MIRSRFLLVTWYALIAAVCAGCGRPSLPGSHFRGDQASRGRSAESEAPLPEQPIIELGSTEAKVRVEAFYPISERNQGLMDLLEQLVAAYPGKLHVTYADDRTPEGLSLRSGVPALAAGVSGLIVNGKNEFEIEREGGRLKVRFLQDMGRFWSAADLRTVIAQEVAAAYGEAGGASE